MTNNIGNVGVGVQADWHAFEARLRRLLDRLEHQLQLHVPVNLNTVRATQQMILWRRLNEKAVEIQLKIAKKSLAVVSSQLASISGFNALKGSIEGFSEHITGLFDNIIPIAMKVGKIGALAGPIATLFGQLTVGAVELTKTLGGGLTAALLAMPALFAAMRGSVYIFQAAFKDAPAVLGPALTQFEKIQANISGAFWEKAAGRAKGFLNAVFPAINEGFTKTGAAAGEFTGKFADQLKKAMTPDRINNFFGNFSKAFDILGDKAAGPLARISTNLLEWGSTLFPRIANFLGDMSAKFDTWLDKAIKTGELDKMLNGLVDVIKQAWGILKDGAQIFTSIADAAKAAGINAFPLKTIMDNIARTMQTDAFQHGLTIFFEGAKRGAEGMQPAFKAFGDLVAALNPTISKFIGDAGQKVGDFAAKLLGAMSDPKFVANMDAMLQGFLKVFDNLSPAIGPFVDKLGEIMHFAGTLADVVSGTLGTAIAILAPIFGEVLKAAEPLVRVLGDLMKSLLEGNQENFQKIGDALVTLVQGVTAFVQALDTPVVKFILNLILDFIGTAIAGFANLAGGVMQIVGGLLKLLSGDWSGFNDIFAGLGKAIEGAFQLFITFFAPAKILKFLGPVGKLLMDAFGPALKGIGDLIGPAFSGIGKFLLDALSSVPGVIGKFFGKIGEFVANSAGDIGKFLVEGLTKGAEMLIGGFISTFVDPIINGIKDLFGIHSPSTVFAEMGQNLVQGLIQGVQMLIDGIVALFQPTIQMIGFLWNALVTGIQIMFQGMLDFLSGGWNLLMQVASTVWNAILQIASVVWNGIMAAAGAAWDFIVAGFNMIMAVGSAIWNGIMAVASTVWNTILSLGQAAIDGIIGFLNGLLDVASGIWNGIIGIAQGAWDGIVAGAQGVVNGIGAVLGGIGDVVSGIFNGVKGTIEGIWNSIQLPNILGGLGIPGFAGGVNNFAGGLAVVGENGPELVRLPKGADVIPSGQSQGIMNNAATPTPTAPPTEGAGQGFVFAPTIYNPEKETTEESLFKSAQNLAYLGLTG